MITKDGSNEHSANRVITAVVIGGALSIGGYCLYKRCWRDDYQKDYLSKELCRITGNPSMSVLYSSNFIECDNLCKEIYESKPIWIGLDCEWKPNETRRQRNKLAIIQICTSNTCLIIQCIHWEELPNYLQLILTSKEIVKSGIGIHGDSKVIRRSFGVHMNGYFDIRYLAVILYEKDLFIPKHCYGLKALTLYLFGTQIPIDSTRSNWEQVPLTNDQIIYGCLDAYYSRMNALLLIHCINTKRIIHYGSCDTLNILRAVDNKQTLSVAIEKCKHLLKRHFVEPQWLQKKKTKHSKKKSKLNNAKNNGHSLEQLEEKWLGMHVEKYQKKRSHLEFWNMYGSDGRFVSRVKKKRVLWYLKRNLCVIVNDKPSEGNLPSFQLVFRLKRYAFPGQEAYVMRQCFGCNTTGIDGKHLFKHSIVPKCYRKWVSKELQKVLSHEIVPLCGICKEKIENASISYRKNIEEVKYLKYNPNTVQIKQVSRSACAIMRQGDKLPSKRRNELLTIVAKHFDVDDIETISEDMIVRASELWNSSKTFGEILMEKLAGQPMELYSFVVGWKQHFIDSLEPKNLKKDWMQDGNETLKQILAIE